MFIKRLLQINLVCSAVIALAFMLFPEYSLDLYGIQGSVLLYLVAQYFGSTHVAFAVLIWIALRSDHPAVLRMVVISFFAGDTAGTIVLLIAQLRGQMSLIGWLLVALSFLLAFGYGYGVFYQPQHSDSASL